MKKFALFILAMGILSSCVKENDDKQETTLIGSWKLIEVYADPGDGSGSFEAVESGKVINFYLDGTINSNGSICDFSIGAATPTSGMYYLSSMTFTSDECSNTDYQYPFEHTGDILIITYPCIEPCRAKYKKI